MTFIIHLPGKDDHQKDFNMSYGEKMEICVNEKYITFLRLNHN